MLRNLNDLKKCTIGATDGDVGRVKDCYFDDHAWVIRYLVVEAGSWLSSRKVLISPISLHKPDWAAHRLPASITRLQVEHSPDIDTDKPVSRQHEVQYLGYFGYPDYWDGEGMWGAGMYPSAMFPVPVTDRGSLIEREVAIETVQRAEREKHRNDDPHLRSFEAVAGYHLQAMDGELGHVDGFLVDDETWAIRYLIVNTSNWWVGHQVLIAPQWIDGVHWSDRTVTADLTREAVKSAPAYDASAPLDTLQEAALYTHYGRPPYRAGRPGA